MYLEYVTEKKVDQSRETIVPAFKPKARIFVCGFGQTRQSWAEALRSWRKKLKGKAFDGDLYVAAGFGEDILLSRDETFCDYPHNYYSGDAEISLIGSGWRTTTRLRLWPIALACAWRLISSTLSLRSGLKPRPFAVLPWPVP